MPTAYRHVLPTSDHADRGPVAIAIKDMNIIDLVCSRSEFQICDLRPLLSGLSPLLLLSWGYVRIEFIWHHTCGPKIPREATSAQIRYSEAHIINENDAIIRDSVIKKRQVTLPRLWARRWKERHGMSNRWTHREGYGRRNT